MSISKIWNPIRYRLTGSEPPHGQSLLLLASTPVASRDRATRVGTQPVTNKSLPGAPIGYAALTPTQTEAWLELVEIVFAEPFLPDS